MSRRHRVESARVGAARCHEVGDDEDDRATPQHPVGVRERRAEVRPPPCRLERDQLAQHTPRLATSLGGRHVLLDPIGEEQETDAVVVARRGECQDRADFGGQSGLAPHATAEGIGTAAVDQEDDGELPLLDVAPHVGRGRPRGDRPVDRPDVVAELVLAHVGELDATALEDAPVLSGEYVADESPEAQLQPADVVDDLAHGTRSVSRMRVMTSSAVTRSASASYVRITRWRRTSGATALMSSGATHPRPSRNAFALAARTSPIAARGLAPYSTNGFFSRVARMISSA